MSTETRNLTVRRRGTVGNLDDLAVGAMKLAKVDGHRVCVVRTSTGVYAIDNACPHEGYGLVQGGLSGNTLTCQWHNWKFDVETGSCAQGEENVTSHDVHIDPNGTVTIELTERSPDEQRPELLASLRRAIERDYVGQMSRDTVRLLRAGVAPADIVWEAVAWGAPRGEYGWDHGLAVMPDCLALLDLFPGDNAALPIVQAMAGLTETERFRPAQPLPPPRAGVSAHSRQEFLAAVEHERLADAQAIMLGALEAGLGPDDLLPWFADVVGAHHLSYGHGAIYVQKAFQLLELIGWHRANVVLGYLVSMHVYATREDLLPYMRPFMRDLQALDLSALAAVESTQAWTPDALVETLLAADKHAPLGATVNALEGGAGIGGVLDAVTLAVSERMLRYDTAGEADMSDDFRWLDITHGLTYANAARWIHARVPSPATQRLAMFTVFLAHYTGRHEWHTKVAPREVLARPAETIAAFGETSVRASMQDVSGAFIVQAHVIKTARAAWEEAERLGSFAPLDAVWRFMHSPRTDRFVASAVQQSIDFLSGRAARE